MLHSFHPNPWSRTKRQRPSVEPLPVCLPWNLCAIGEVFFLWDSHVRQYACGSLEGLLSGPPRSIAATRSMIAYVSTMTLSDFISKNLDATVDEWESFAKTLLPMADSSPVWHCVTTAGTSF